MRKEGVYSRGGGGGGACLNRWTLRVNASLAEGAYQSIVTYSRKFLVVFVKCERFNLVIQVSMRRTTGVSHKL